MNKSNVSLLDQIARILTHEPSTSDHHDEDFDTIFVANLSLISPISCSCATESRSSWIIDSGATDHMSPNPSLIDPKTRVQSKN